MENFKFRVFKTIAYDMEIPAKDYTEASERLSIEEESCSELSKSEYFIGKIVYPNETEHISTKNIL